MPQPLNTLCTEARPRPQVAAELVASVAEDVIAIGWFIEACAYPGYARIADWALVLHTAAQVRRRLEVAEALLRADHTTARKAASGASQQAAA